MIIGSWPAQAQEREWQSDALEKLATHKSPDFLCVATPGAGKTRFACRVLHNALRSGLAGRAVVVVPTEHLKRQWAKAAALVGINLDPKWENDAGPEAPDYHGVVVTYQQVASNPDVHRMYCRRDTYVVMDEPHHGGDGRVWGDAMRLAFEPARRRLLLSGTPFRSDNKPIPFVTYENGKSRADFNFSYGKALAAGGVCRDIYFPSYEGDMSWVSSSGKRLDATFADKLSERQAAERLRTAIASSNPWVKEVITEAHDRLVRIRRDEGHPSAGGLIIAQDQFHAERLVDIVTGVTKQRPAFAVSDVQDASEVITRFGQGSDAWLVAVRMVSEGVDIPRLRVGVYLSNITTELNFRQVAGRFVRWQSDLDADVPQPAYLFMPKDPMLVPFAQKIKEERDHELAEEQEELERKQRERKEEVDCLPGSGYLPIDAIAYADDWYVSDGPAFTQSELRAAREQAKRAGAHIPDVEVAKLRRQFLAELSAAGYATGVVDGQDAPPVETVTLKERKDNLKRQRTRRVSRLAILTEQEYKSVNTRLMGIFGVPVRQMTEVQLEDCIALLDRWMEEATSGQPIT